MTLEFKGGAGSGPSLGNQNARKYPRGQEPYLLVQAKQKPRKPAEEKPPKIPAKKVRPIPKEEAEREKLRRQLERRAEELKKKLRWTTWQGYHAPGPDQILMAGGPLKLGKWLAEVRLEAHETLRELTDVYDQMSDIGKRKPGGQPGNQNARKWPAWAWYRAEPGSPHTAPIGNTASDPGIQAGETIEEWFERAILGMTPAKDPRIAWRETIIEMPARTTPPQHMAPPAAAFPKYDKNDPRGTALEYQLWQRDKLNFEDRKRKDKFKEDLNFTGHGLVPYREIADWLWAGGDDDLGHKRRLYYADWLVKWGQYMGGNQVVIDPGTPRRDPRRPWAKVRPLPIERQPIAEGWEKKVPPTPPGLPDPTTSDFYTLEKEESWVQTAQRTFWMKRDGILRTPKDEQLLELAIYEMLEEQTGNPANRRWPTPPADPEKRKPGAQPGNQNARKNPPGPPKAPATWDKVPDDVQRVIDRAPKQRQNRQREYAEYLARWSIESFRGTKPEDIFKPAWLPDIHAAVRFGVLQDHKNEILQASESTEQARFRIQRQLAEKIRLRIFGH